jgi:beta-mannosidase
MAAFTQYPLSTGWSFRDADDQSSNAWLPVPVVPSVVHQDLQANNKYALLYALRIDKSSLITTYFFRLKNPYVGFNELEARWVNEKSWTYRTVFQKPAVPAGSSIVLAFDGLDTFATVKLDGSVILESDNMFLAHRVDVTKALESEGDHVLEIDFDCAMRRARELRDNDTKHNWASFNGDPARMAARKAQYHWGWDWGPVLSTAGIWRAVRLEVYSARVSDLWTEVELAQDHQTAQISAFAELDAVDSTDSYKVRFTLSLNGQEVGSEVVTPRDTVAKVTFDVKQPSLWWPNGYGEPTLYEVSVSLEKEEDEVHKVSKKIGIRTAEIIQQPDKHGKSFYFRINGVDVFCGGSCWIPADNLLPSITAERYRKWIELMVAGRQVMIRYVRAARCDKQLVNRN